MKEEPALEAGVADLRAEHEIRQAILRYLRGVDRKDFQLMASAYHEDAYEDHGPFQGGVPAFVEWVRCRHETIDQAMHFLGNCLIEVEGNRAFVESYCIVVQHERTGVSGFGSVLPTYKRTTMGIRYVDRFEKRAQQWKIAHRILVCEWIDEGFGNLNFGPQWTVAKRSRDDAVYRIRTLESSAK